MPYLKIDGRGDPNTSLAFAEAVAALYPVAYKLKFASKRDLGRDYVVPPLEGLWWAEDMDAFTTARDKSRWDWTIMHGPGLDRPGYVRHRHRTSRGQGDSFRTRGVRFTQPPTDMGPVTSAVFDDTCGNLIQIAAEEN